MQSEVLKNLNDEQGRAAAILGKPVCIHAGPGSGKTRALTHSVAYRIEQGAAADSICAITFTNKAKNEIKERVAKLVDKRASKGVFVGTYHGFLSIHVLGPNRKHALIKALGYESSFVIADEDDADKIIEDTVKNLAAPTQALMTIAEIKVRSIKDYMSTRRAEGLFAKDAINQFSKEHHTVIREYKRIEASLKVLAQSPDSFHDKEVVSEALKNTPKLKDLLYLGVWRQYEVRMARLNALDYDGMMVVAKHLLANDVKVAQSVATEFKHILLDEFQDTNNVQWDCMRLIIDQMSEKNVFVVGDPDQCIYQFRSANPTIMREFQSYYPDAEMCYLTMNYRSTKENVALCNSVKGFIDPKNLDHPMRAQDKSCEKPYYQFFPDDRTEATFVLENIRQVLEEGVKPEKIAVLYRGKNQKRAIEEALGSTQIQYTVVGDTSYYDTKEVKDVVNMLRMLSNEQDVMGFARAIGSSTIPVDSVTLRNAIEAAKEQGQTLTPMQYLYERFKPKGKLTESAVEKMEFWKQLNGLLRMQKSQTESEFIYAWYKDGLREAGVTDEDMIKQGISIDYVLGEFRRGLEAGIVHPSFQSDMDTERASFHKNVLTGVSGFYNQYFLPKLRKYSETNDKSKPEKLLDRVANVERLFANLEKRLHDNISFEDAITELVLLTEQKTEDLSGCVHLMTLHASKGLEFDTVFLIGTEQRSYFSQSTMEDDFQSEACAAFVGMSRAERRNIITGARCRFIPGSVDNNSDELVFIKMMDKSLINDFTEQSVRQSLRTSSQFSRETYASDINQYGNTGSSLSSPVHGQVNLKQLISNSHFKPG